MRVQLAVRSLQYIGDGRTKHKAASNRQESVSASVYACVLSPLVERCCTPFQRQETSDAKAFFLSKFLKKNLMKISFYHRNFGIVWKKWFIIFRKGREIDAQSIRVRHLHRIRRESSPSIERVDVRVSGYPLWTRESPTWYNLTSCLCKVTVVYVEDPDR